MAMPTFLAAFPADRYMTGSTMVSLPGSGPDCAIAVP
jgi:hypothetical protein